MLVQLSRGNQPQKKASTGLVESAESTKWNPQQEEVKSGILSCRWRNQSNREGDLFQRRHSPMKHSEHEYEPWQPLGRGSTHTHRVQNWKRSTSLSDLFIEADSSGRNQLLPPNEPDLLLKQAWQGDQTPTLDQNSSSRQTLLRLLGLKPLKPPPSTDTSSNTAIQHFGLIPPFVSLPKHLPLGWNILDTNRTVGGLLGYSSENSIRSLNVPAESKTGIRSAPGRHFVWEIELRNVWVGWRN